MALLAHMLNDFKSKFISEKSTTKGIKNTKH